MATCPNVLFLMTDQMQGRVLGPDHPCKTPNLDRLAQRGVQFLNAYTPNAVCSPARASLMTGLLPHNHGVLEVTHCVDPDQSLLRSDRPHWAQHLEQAGYRTGYFGKWHVERSNELEPFGWQVNGVSDHSLWKRYADKLSQNSKRFAKEYLRARYVESPKGYRRSLLYAVTECPAEYRAMGITSKACLDFLTESVKDRGQPWCCFVSFTEPHDPFVCGKQAFEQYQPDRLPLPANGRDELANRPNIYRKAGRPWLDVSDKEKKEAMACYYASITEIDSQFGRVLDFVEQAGQLDNTIVVMTTDHGELLGAHGLYCKNFSGFEEIYNIPLIVAGPGICQGTTSKARVGLHDLCPTLLELTGAEPITVPDSKSFVPVLRNPGHPSNRFLEGYAEYHGTRYKLSQRILWQGSWKFMFNGFDFDELYNLDKDPYEMNNLIDDPSCAEQVHDMTKRMWEIIRDTGDRSLYHSHYPILRVAPYGPGIAE